MGARGRIHKGRLAALAAQGFTTKEAAAAMGMSYPGVFRAARRLGLQFANGHHQADRSRSEDMAAAYQAGETLQQIGDRYGVTRERVRQLLRKHTAITKDMGEQSVRAAKGRAERATARDRACMAKVGCDWNEYRRIRQIGRDLVASGVGVYRTPIRAFIQQKSSAHQRGIGWELTFWQWRTLWQWSGRWTERGRGQGYVMCRHGDVGPYAVGNVFIAPARENSSKQRRHSNLLPIGVWKRANSFVAQRMIDGKRLYLGAFSTADLAHAAYLSAPRPELARTGS